MSGVGSGELSEAISIQQFMSENWEYFDYGALERSADDTLTRISRQLPPEYYDQVRNRLLEIMILTGLGGRVVMKTVIDSCIIVGDALRVANGKSSSTERILSSGFAEALAPRDIQDEVERNIRSKLQDGPALKVALAHANKLLSRIRIVSGISCASLARARQLLANHPKDAPFLAIYFEAEADAIVTREKGTFEKPGVEKWDLGEFVDVVVAYESGSLALVIAGAVIEAVAEAFLTLLVTILQALVEAIIVSITITQALFTKSIDALAKIPGWALAILLVVGLGTILAYAFHEGFRNYVDTGAVGLKRKLGEFMANLAEFSKSIWRFVRELMVLLWNTMLPVTGALVVVGGVLMRRIDRLLATCQSIADWKSQRLFDGPGEKTIPAD